MPPKRRSDARTTGTDQDSGSSRCKALTTSGQPCRKRVVPGLTVCRSHGGGTAASVRVSEKRRASLRASQLWGISPDAGSVDVKAELEQLARNKLTDIRALRGLLGEEPGDHIGLLIDSDVKVDYDIVGTVQSKEGTQRTRSKKSGTSPWVQELHKAEQEYLQILRLIHEITGNSEELNVDRVRLQTAREVARLMKAFPGLGVDEIAREVSKRA